MFERSSPNPEAAPANPSIKPRRVRWHLIYYFLAALDIAGIGGSLYLGHKIMQIYRASVDVNQRWADILSDLSVLVDAAGDIDVPGNDVFDTHDVELEQNRFKSAASTFRTHIEDLREKLEALPDSRESRSLLDGVRQIGVTMSRMLSAGENIFVDFRDGDIESAARHMANMDRTYGRVRQDISKVAETVRRVQKTNFADQLSDAAYLTTFEYPFAGLILFMIACVALYGHKLAREMRRSEQAQELYLIALQTNEAMLEQRVAMATRSLVENKNRLELLSEELKRSLVEARSASRAKSEFLANMSHELRTPLNAIIGFAEVMHRGTFGPVGDKRYDGYVRDIWRSGRHLLGIINDILDVARIEAGKIDLYEEAVDLAELVEMCVRLVEARAEQGGITLGNEIESGLPPLWGDPRLIKQVLVNLLSNAVKFTGAGGKIDVRVARRPNGDLEVTVRDTGIGMRPEDVPRALEPFGQIDSAIARKYEGVGLGLPICNALMKLHGGAIEVETALGKGTAVSAVFPAARLRARERTHEAAE
jgi:signal transduction histidine kinase